MTETQAQTNATKKRLREQKRIARIHALSPIEQEKRAARLAKHQHRKELKQLNALIRQFGHEAGRTRFNKRQAQRKAV